MRQGAIMSEYPPQGGEAWRFDVDAPDFVRHLKTPADCDAARDMLMAQVATIEAQIVRAQERQRRTGQYASGDWFQRARTSLRYKRLKLQQVQDHRATLRRQRATMDDAWRTCLGAVVRSLQVNHPEVFAQCVADAAATSPECFTPDNLARVRGLK